MVRYRSNLDNYLEGLLSSWLDMTACRVTNKICQAIPSFGFSGAGFLTCYHLGAAKCLLEHGLLTVEPRTDDSKVPILTGVSGGAITVAAVSAGVDPEMAMVTTLAVAERTRQEGLLDSFNPG